MTTEAIKKIAQLWHREAAGDVRPHLRDMLTLSDGDATAFVDLIVEAGSLQDDLNVSPEVMDEMASIVFSEANPQANPPVRMRSGRPE